MYRHWPTFIEGIELCPIQLPGRESRMRESAHTTYESLADALADALEPYLDRPYALFGHCGSALAAYETSVRLVERDYPQPAALFVSSEVAPQDGPYGRFLQMTDAELAEELRKLVIEMGGTPHPQLLDMLLGVLRIDVDANKQYHIPDPVKLPCPIVSIGWRGDNGVLPELMSGWTQCGETTFELLDGDHYAFLDAPEPLLSLIATRLNNDRN
jgi:surfactin synthase thioesterase subunit